MKSIIALSSSGLALALAASTASAGLVQLRITTENLVPANGISFAPLRLGFHDGTFDSFDDGQAATAPIISIAEGGSGSDWFPFFAAQQPNGNAGSVGMGPLQPGQSRSNVITVDSATNRFLSFGSMVVPSNDYFIGNDSPTEYEVFDSSGNLLLGQITQTADEIWDNGSETEDPANAAFVVGGVNSQRVPENGVVHFDFSELEATFNGLTTGGGYVLNSQLSAGQAIYRITIEVVPAPGAVASFGVLGLAAGLRRRRVG
jgi:hypothetical protein